KAKSFLKFKPACVEEWDRRSHSCWMESSTSLWRVEPDRFLLLREAVLVAVAVPQPGAPVLAAQNRYRRIWQEPLRKAPRAGRLQPQLQRRDQMRRLWDHRSDRSC